jgi:hypothetical protein
LSCMRFAYLELAEPLEIQLVPENQFIGALYVGETV